MVWSLVLKGFVVDHVLFCCCSPLYRSIALPQSYSSQQSQAFSRTMVVESTLVVLRKRATFLPTSCVPSGAQGVGFFLCQFLLTRTRQSSRVAVRFYGECAKCMHGSAQTRPDVHAHQGSQGVGELKKGRAHSMHGCAKRVHMCASLDLTI